MTAYFDVGTFKLLSVSLNLTSVDILHKSRLHGNIVKNFTVFAALTTPKDGIQRLRTMQAQAGIWTMRVEMLIEPQDVVVLDKQSGVRNLVLMQNL